MSNQHTRPADDMTAYELDHHADQLAEALEDAIETLKAWQIDWEELDSNPDYKPEYSTGTLKAIRSLADYRAAHPKQTSTVPDSGH